MFLTQRPNGPVNVPGRPIRRALQAASVGALALVLAACSTTSGDVQDNRHFANEVVTRSSESPATLTPTPSLKVDATPVVAASTPSASPASLLLSRGAPDTLYTAVDDYLVSLVVQDGAAVITPIDSGQGLGILAFDPSPTGDRVAVLASNEGGQASLLIFSREGRLLLGPTDVLTPDSATPESRDETARRYLVTWSPQGTGVLVTDGLALESVSISGEVSPVPLDGVDGMLTMAALSPQGTRIMYRVQHGDGSAHVYVRDLQAEKTRELRPLSTSESEGLNALRWLPNGTGVSYIRGSLDRGVVMHGQLFVYRLGQERAELIATPGQGGPAATITEAVVSPDGQQVAYVISLLDGSAWSFHSMWVRNLDGTASYQVPVVPRGVVGHLVWVNGGVAWEQRREPSSPGQVLFVQPDEYPVVVFNKATAPQASPGTTPEASPAATPAGTP